MAEVPASGMSRLDGKVALVTGASGGIGQEVVRTFVRVGGVVVATDISNENPFAGTPNIEFARYDVTSEADTSRVVGDVLSRHGRIDILVLCAGSISKNPLTESTNEEWDAIFRVNVLGVVNPLRAVYPHMVSQNQGKIVALGSIAAKIGGVASGPSYVAAKSAVHGLIKWVAKAGAAHGVHANIIAPGPVETPMWLSVADRRAQAAAGNVPLGRFGLPEDIAQAILFLASPASNWITGTVLDVNGGMLMD